MNGRLVARGVIGLWVASAFVLGCGGGGSSPAGAGGSAAGGGTGGQGGGLSPGGHAGGPAAGGAGGGAACAPCFLSIANRINCDPSPTATCVEQRSQTTNTDGTITIIDNKCYSDGSKTLQHQTVGPVDAGVAGTDSVVVQVFKNGAVCAGGDISISGTVSNEVLTEIIKDAAGNPLATLVVRIMRPDGGEMVETKTITCPGQAPEALGTCPSSGSSAICTAGSCM